MKPEERKNHILACAKKLFSKNGYYETQISDIIKEAGIARGTLYQYFKNKDAIYITLLENYYDKWLSAMEAWVKEIDFSTITHLEYMKGRINRNLTFFANDQDLCSILLRVGLGLPAHLESMTRKFETRILDVTINDIKIGIHSGNIKKDMNVELAANLLSGALLRAAYFYFGQHRKKSEHVDIKAATNEITAIFSSGIF